jgi:hypothetical protein
MSENSNSVQTGFEVLLKTIRFKNFEVNRSNLSADLSMQIAVNMAQIATICSSKAIAKSVYTNEDRCDVQPVRSNPSIAVHAVNWSIAIILKSPDSSLMTLDPSRNRSGNPQRYRSSGSFWMDRFAAELFDDVHSTFVQNEQRKL